MKGIYTPTSYMVQAHTRSAAPTYAQGNVSQQSNQEKDVPKGCEQPKGLRRAAEAGR